MKETGATSVSHLKVLTVFNCVIDRLTLSLSGEVLAGEDRRLGDRPVTRLGVAPVVIAIASIIIGTDLGYYLILGHISIHI